MAIIVAKADGTNIHLLKPVEFGVKPLPGDVCFMPDDPQQRYWLVRDEGTKTRGIDITDEMHELIALDMQSDIDVTLDNASYRSQ